MSTWLIAADRGGTFTDCLARGQFGPVRRCKVLSRGVVRVAVEQRIGDQTLVVRLPQDDLPEEFLRGWRCVGAGESREVSHSSGEGVLTFRGGTPAAWQPGSAVDLQTGEPAAVIGARLLTGTPLNG